MIMIEQAPEFGRKRSEGVLGMGDQILMGCSTKGWVKLGS